MPIITNLQKFDGQVWNNYQLGAKAINITFDETDVITTDVQTKIKSIDNIITTQGNSINSLFTLTNNDQITEIKDLDVILKNAPSPSKDKIVQGSTLNNIASKINWLLTPRSTTPSVSAGNNIIRIAQAGVNAECPADTTKTITFKWDPVTDAGFTNDWVVLCALYPQFTGSNQSMMNCNRYWYQRTQSGDYQAKTFYATVNNRATTRNWYGGSIYWRVLMLYLGG